MRKYHAWFAAALLLSISLSARVQGATEDRYENFNRKVHAFNEFADSKVLRPLAKGYSKIMPKVVQMRVRSFFRNLGDINVMLNDLLQGKGEATLTDAARLLLNTSIGIGGLFDPAAKIGLTPNDEDFGQTLAVRGVSSGAYIVLPFLGPSTVRDGLSQTVDSLFNPLRYCEHVPTRNTLYATETVQGRADLIPLEKFITGDKYEFYRDAYLQRREFLIKDGEVEDSFDDDF